MAELSSQKFLAPHLDERIIQRPRFFKKINEYRSGIINIVAPAGFGKTVLLSQLAKEFKQPTVWYHLDEYDNDPTVFWRSFIEGCNKLNTGFGKEVLLFLDNSSTSVNRGRTVLSMLIKELQKQQEGVTIVFDDCHIMQQPELKDFFVELLHQLPLNAKVLMATRFDVFQLERMTLEKKILHFSADDLYFTSEDVEGYSPKNDIVPTKNELYTIIKNTEGWPLAVSLSLYSSAQCNEGIGKTDKNTLFNYLAAEMLTGEEEHRGFLTAISVFEEITPKYCDLLLDRKDSREILALLHKRYFFLTSFDEKKDEYRYHNLFRDFLIERLGEKRHDLLKKAGMVLYEAGETVQAVKCFFAAGMFKNAEEIITKEGWKLIGRGDWQTVERWVNNYSDKELAKNPWLSLYKSQIEINRGRIFTGDNWINHTLKAFSDVGEHVGLAESRMLKAKILRYQGQYQDSLNLLRLAIPDLRQEEMKERFDPYLEESYTLMLCGRFAEAEEVLNRALKLAEQCADTVLMTYFYEGLGTVNFAWGYYDRSLYYYRRGMAISPDKGLRNYYFQDSIGPIYIDWGEQDYAYEYLKQSITAKESFGLIESLPSTYCQFGNVLLDRGELLQAEHYFRKALNIMEEHGGDHFLHTLTNLLLSVCLGAQGNMIEAQDLICKTRSQAGNQSQYINGLFRVVECFFLLQTNNPEAAYSCLHDVLPSLEEIGARKLLCVSYSILALIGIRSNNQKDIREFVAKSLKLASEMNFAHDFMHFFEIYQPLLFIGFESNI